LTYVGLGAYAALRNPLAAADQAAFPLGRPHGEPPDFFSPISASEKDDLLLPPGYRYDVVCAWGDDLGSTDPDRRAEVLGFNNDFTAYFPIDALRGGRNSGEGLLWVNHEYPNPLFVSGYTGKGKKTERQILAEKRSVGGSVLHVRRDGGRWRRVRDSRYTRRLTALYPKIPVTGPAGAVVAQAIGTLANCSGGRTPWNTVLSCEENFRHYNSMERYGWSAVAAQQLDEHQYGWVVEVDPFGELPPRKHSALGRFEHENAALRLGPTGRLVVYMGHDAEDEHLYKFVSAEPYNRRTPRAEQYQLLTQGTLYAADFKAGKWVALDFRRNRSRLEDEGLESQADVLLHAPAAAAALGATPLDRTECCAIHPADGTLYVALTYNAAHGNLYGQVLRLVEDHDNPEGESFRYEVFLAGGPQSGLACPDNLRFDSKGNLWVVCDIACDELNKGAYKSFGNNGIYVVPTVGPSAGDAFQFASGPVECELTGPWFADDEETLFLSVQHPGEGSNGLDSLTSHWPKGGAAIPQPAVVAITGFRRGGAGSRTRS
jgi:secreted PhoX family phosphatase